MSNSVSQRYQTASEVIREGLRLLEYQERDRDAAFNSSKAKLARGSAQAHSGEVVIPAEMLGKIAALKRKRLSGEGMSESFILTLEAEADALAIGEFIATDDSEAAADRIFARIHDECEKLGAMPGIGHGRVNLLGNDHNAGWSGPI